MAKDGLIHITKSTFSGVSSVNIDNCFSSNYTHYLVSQNIFGGSYCYIRLRSSGSTESGANYRNQYIYFDGTLVAGGRATGATYWDNQAGYTDAGGAIMTEIWFSNPYESVRTTVYTETAGVLTGNLVGYTQVGAHDLSNSYDGFTIVPGGGTLTGSVSVFGLVKS